ncbi:beta-N-acetylhexosaminidase, partial [Streptomyces durbertensis]
MTDTPLPGLGLVPAPREVRVDGGELTLDAGTVLDAGPGTEDVARWLRATVGTATGLDLPPHTGHADGPVLRLAVDPAAVPDPEAYRLEITEHGVELLGGDAAGVFWGAQTLRQLLGPDAHRRANLGRTTAWTLPHARISDRPRMRWRGFMLDVSRHFTPKEGVLRTLDLLAAHKLNVLHLHLTDDQGWRMEIRRYPKLTEVGARRPRTRVGHTASDLWDERVHGGRYTQDDLREIVAYAAARHITVVPEIDIPGHSQATVTAYPELGNTDALTPEQAAGLDVWTGWGVSPHILAPTEHTLRFFENVLEEVLDVFPGEFVHLGGDEAVKDQWRASATAQRRIAELGLRDEDGLQAWFIRHFDRWLAARGRRLVGWDEILEGDSLGPEGEGLTPGATVSSWRGYAGGVEAARAGHDVIMCPEQHVYLDHRQADGDDEPVPIGYVRTLRDVYHFEPVPPQLAGTDAARHVIGAQANLWTEVVENQQRFDYQVFPRLAAFAEVVWSDPATRDFDDFDRRVTAAHYARLEALGVDY